MKELWGNMVQCGNTRQWRGSIVYSSGVLLKRQFVMIALSTDLQTSHNGAQWSNLNQMEIFFDR